MHTVKSLKKKIQACFHKKKITSFSYFLKKTKKIDIVTSL